MQKFLLSLQQFFLLIYPQGELKNSGIASAFYCRHIKYFLNFSLYDTIDINKGIDLTKSYNNKECIVCHYYYFNHRFKSQNSVCNGFYDLMILCFNFSDIAIITVKSSSKSDTSFVRKIMCLMIVSIYKMHVK